MTVLFILPVALKPFTTDWDLNPRAGTQTHVLGLKPSQNPWYLVSGPNEAQVLDVSSQNLVRDKVIGKKWIYSDSEKHTPWKECGPSQRVSVAK